VLGAVVGSFIPVVGTQLGWMIGSLIGGIVDPQKIYGPRLTDAVHQTAQDGVPRSWGYGTYPTAGNLIWTSPVSEKKHKSGKGGPQQITYTYLRSYAIGVCRGPIAGYLIIKRNGKIVYDTRTDAELTAIGYTADQISETRAAQSKFQQIVTLYYGDDSQMPDPTMQAVKGVNNAPAFRGSAYIVVRDDDVTDLRAAVPQYEFVVSNCGTRTDSSLSASTPRWLGTAHTSSGLLAVVRPLSYAGAWVGTADIVVTPTTDAYVQGLQRFGNSMFAFVNGSSTLWKAALTDLTTWSAAPGIPSTATFARIRVSGNRLFYVNLDTSAYYLDGEADTTWTTTLAFSGGVGDDKIANVVGNGTDAIAVNGSGQLYSAPGSNGSSFVLGANVRGASSFSTLSGRGDVNGSRFIFGGKAYSGAGGAVRTDDVGATGTQCTFPSGSPNAEPDQVKYCGDNKWLIAFKQVGGSPHDGLYLSTDNGVTFPPVALPFPMYFQSLYDQSIAVDATSGRVVIMGQAVSDSSIHAFYTDLVLLAAGSASTIWTEISRTGTIASGINEIYPIGSIPTYAGVPVPDSPGHYVSPVTGSLVGPSGTTIARCTTLLSEIVSGACISRNVLTYNVSELTDVVIGQRNASQTSAQQVISSLMPGYQFDGAEYDGYLHFPKRGGATSFAVVFDDLVTRHGDPIEWTRRQEAELLRKVTVGYIDPATTYTTTTQNWERRTGTIVAQGESTIELPVVGTKDWAKRAAEINVKVAWAESNSCKFSVAVDFAALAPAQVGTLTDRDGVVHRIRITRIQDEGGVRMIEAIREQANTYTSGAVGVGAVKPQFPSSGIIGPTDLVLMNLPAGRAEDDRAGLYWASRGYLSGWAGCLLQVNRASLWTALDAMMGPCTMGSLTAILPNADRDYTDATSTLAVDIGAGHTLDSATSDQVLDGANKAAILYADGTAEIVQFQTATATGDGTYNLTMLQRGRADTATGSHAIGDRFVLLDASVQFAGLTITDAGTTLSVRAVSNGTDPDMATTQSITPARFEALREWSVASLAKSRDGSNNVTITWNGRPRLGTNVQPRQSDHFTGYRVEYTSGGVTIRHNIARTPLVIMAGVIDTQEVTTDTYTAAQQTTDFGTLPGSLAVAVSAINDQQGAGPTTGITA
jgi:hypothetical protein